MPRYAPLPLVSIDPRNEAQLVKDAAQKVYEASNGVLNDFSSGNPLAVLLEGQAFAQGEFLFWANQLPEKILIEWIGPFLGAMRRLGTPAAALVVVTIPPQNREVQIPAGSIFSTDPQLTSGQSITFVSSTDSSIPAGYTNVSIPVYSKYVGSVYNSPSNSITTPPAIGVTGISCTNPQPAVGGSDVETDAEVKERFFTLIRRRNPVSQSDWENFFIDLFGVGTITSVQPNRSSLNSYDYNSDYLKPNGQVSFFVLGPNGVELTEDQIRRGQNAVNFSVPIENQGHLYPITLSQAQYNLTLELDSNGTYGPNYKSSALEFRNRAYSVFQPGNVFPATVNPTVSDIDAAFYGTFDSTTRFKDPRIISSSVYNTPNTLSKEAATYTKVRSFEPKQTLLNTDDLIQVKGALDLYYPVEEGFTPYSSSKKDQTIYGNLTLKQIKNLGVGSFSLGDVVYYQGNLHVVCESLNINSDADIQKVFSSGKVSGSKTYKAWAEGDSYSYSVDSVVNPDIVMYDYSEDEFKPSTVVGRLVWLVSKNFTLGVATNGMTGAQAEFKVGSALNSGSLNLKLLESGTQYSQGDWVFTPQIGSGPNFEVDPYYHYVDKNLGAISKFALVESPFTYSPGDSTSSEYFNLLVEEGVLKEVSVFDGTDGLPVYLYKPRFECGQYLEFKENQNSPSSYFIAARYFTPSSSSIQTLIDNGDVVKLAPSTELESQLLSLVQLRVKGRVKSLTISSPGSGLTNGQYLNVPLSYDPYDDGDGVGLTANVIVSGNQISYVEIVSSGKWYKVGETLAIGVDYLGGKGTSPLLSVSGVYQYEEKIKPFAKMFTFFKGEKTFFRDGNSVQLFTATSHVTPLFDFSVYYNNGVFVESESLGQSEFNPGYYVPFYSPDYGNYAEDTVIDPEGKNLYRVMTAFSPGLTVLDWTRVETENTVRHEEYSGNLLRYVALYSCEEPVLSQFDLKTSAFKLGVAQISLIPKGSGNTPNLNQKMTFVWENSSLSDSAELSWYPGTSYPYSPPDYREGTLRL